MKYDFIIIGSGIIGLTLAYKLKKRFKESAILILEKEKVRQSDTIELIASENFASSIMSPNL